MSFITRLPSRLQNLISPSVPSWIGTAPKNVFSKDVNRQYHHPLVKPHIPTTKPVFADVTVDTLVADDVANYDLTPTNPLHAVPVLIVQPLMALTWTKSSRLGISSPKPNPQE
ncbi:hypothetical protein HK097_003649 [Rhizophlyctis rosea]|uniref:Uncharacterized protein n=1 Tax=Rhizophlyctis rosea TaxID=64517 RepID=A0AAD5SMC1_9FUNG|nr:hypothetical protein HK097_003649 [Rhizophlyctis rosea]